MHAWRARHHADDERIARQRQDDYDGEDEDLKTNRVCTLTTISGRQSIPLVSITRDKLKPKAVCKSSKESKAKLPND